MTSPIPSREAKQLRLRQAEEVTSIIASGMCGAHDISSFIAAACEHTHVYKPGTLSDAPQFEPGPTSVQVTAETTQAAIFRLCTEEENAGDIDINIAVLNFASARKPCGGFKSGAKSQEEDLARHSALSACVNQQFVVEDYYNTNKRQSVLYSDTIVYSARVPFFRNALTEQLCRPYFASIITAPAPNLGAYKKKKSQDDMKEIYMRRLSYVLTCALKHRHDTLVLGAWGCGVFRFPPELAAECFKHLLIDTQFKGAFKRIVFAVYDGPSGPGRCFKAFNSTLGTPQ